MKTPTEHVHLRVPPAQKRQIDAEAKRRGETVNKMLGKLIAATLGPPGPGKT